MTDDIPPAFMIRYPTQPNQRIFLVSELGPGSTVLRMTVRHLRDGEINPYDTDIPFSAQNHSEIEQLFFERTDLLGEVIDGTR